MQPAAMTVLRAFFTGWSEGRLKPAPFAILFMIAMAGAYLFSFAYMAIFEATPGNRIGAGSLAGPFGLPLTRQVPLWLAFACLALFTVGGANVMAKRFRDMGLPGGLAVSMLSIMMIVLIGGGETVSPVKDLFVFSIFLALLAIPTDRLEAGSGRSVTRPHDGKQ